MGAAGRGRRTSTNESGREKGKLIKKINFHILLTNADLIGGHLVVKVVVDRDLCAGLLVDPVHVAVECWPVAIVVVVAVGDEEVGVDHLVQERLHQVRSRPQLEQGHAQPDGAVPGAALVAAHAGAQRHPGRPTHLAGLQAAPEESAVELTKQGVEVGGGVDVLPLGGHQGGGGLSGGGRGGVAGGGRTGHWKRRQVSWRAQSIKRLLWP